MEGFIKKLDQYLIVVVLLDLRRAFQIIV